MYGWRARLGLIVPSSNTVNEPEFERTVPEGVSVHTSRMRLVDANAEELDAMGDRADRCADLLATADVDLVAYGCTTGSLVNGPGYDEEIEGRLADIAGVPTVATAASVRRALDALGLDTVAITTPYIEELDERERSFFEAAGHEVLDVTGPNILKGLDIGALRPEEAYREARALDHADADGIFISCTNYRTFEVIETLEADLGMPVVTSNQATLWDALRTAGVDYAGIELGRLFETTPDAVPLSETAERTAAKPMP